MAKRGRRRKAKNIKGGVFYKMVADAQREIITTTLSVYSGNRTHAALALGLPRTYLHRLIRDLKVKDAA